MNTSAPMPITPLVLDPRWGEEDFYPREDLCDYLPLVRNIAHGMRARLGKRADVDDLYGDGCLGLVRARLKWEGRCPFQAFAIKCIRRQMFDGFYSTLIVGRYGAAKGDRRSVVSLDDPAGPGSRQTIGDMIADYTLRNPDETILFREVMDLVGGLRAIDQERVAEMLADPTPEEVRAMGARESARRRGGRWLTIRTIRTAIGVVEEVH